MARTRAIAASRPLPDDCEDNSDYPGVVPRTAPSSPVDDRARPGQSAPGAPVMVAIDRTLGRAIAGSLSAALSHKLLFALVSVLSFCVASYAILSLQPVFEGTTLLLSGQPNIEQSTTATKQQPDTANALIRTALSDEVVRVALAQPSFAPLVAAIPPGRESTIDRARGYLFGRAVERPRVSTAIDMAVADVKRRLIVRSEPNSNVIEIGFRDPDPKLAADFANAVAAAFMDRHLSLSSRSGAAEFFERQKARFDEDLRRAAGALERFSVENGLYSIGQQRELLLRRLSDLAAAMAANRSAIAEKLGQRQALTEQLRKLAPVARSPYVSSLVDALGEEKAPGPRAGDGRGPEDRITDPPLLLVRVYQESMVTLFKISADIRGATNLEQQQQQEQVKLTAELNALSQKAEQLDKLQRDLAQATQNSNQLAKRMIEEQIAASLHAARFTSLKVMQRATEPIRPAFPNYRLLIPAAAVFSVAAGLGAAFLFSRRR